MDVYDAVTSRKSVRAYTDQPVPREVLERVLDTARRAPSGGNLQPWHAAVLTGDALTAIRAAAADRLAGLTTGPAPEYPMYPEKLWSPYRERRFRNGEQLYESVGVTREDKAGRVRQFSTNWDLFGAPVGMFVFVDRGMNHPQWSDLGMWLQTIMLLLRGEGLDSCPQEAWSVHHDVVTNVVKIPDNLMLFCGMAIGYADTNAPVNTLVTERAPLEEVVTFLDAPGALTTRVD